MRYSIRAEAGKPLELDILDVIADGFFFVSARSVVAQLKSFQGDSIKVRINSRGGEVTEGFAIYELLKQNKASVEVEVLGLAASIASVIAMAGDKITIGTGGFVMIHNPFGCLCGESDDFRRLADLLDNMQGVIADVYVARTGQPRDEILKLMNAETYMNAKEALERGFVDYVTPAKTKPKKARAAASAFAMFAEAELDGAPAELLAAVREAHAPDETEPPEPETPPSPVARAEETQTQPRNNGEENIMPNEDPKTNPYASIVAALGLLAGASETDILGRIGRLRELEAQALALTSVTDSAQLVGGLRGMKERADAADKAQAELTQVKAERDKQRFASLIAKGQTDRKLTPAEAKQYTEVFVARVAEGRGAEYISEVEGYINAAPRKFSETVSQPAPRSAGSVAASATTWNGKTYAELAPLEKHKLNKEDPELFEQMRAEHQQRVA